MDSKARASASAFSQAQCPLWCVSLADSKVGESHWGKFTLL